MLVLSRRVGESIAIGDSVEVVVLRVTNRSTTVGINAPKQITIVRKEIHGIGAERANPGERRPLAAERRRPSDAS